MKIVAETFKNLFPSVDIVEQKEIERVIVINYDKEHSVVQIRQYKFQQTEGIDRGLYNAIRD